MKLIKDLEIAIKNKEFHQKQFEATGEKHILFINPQLSGKHLYKYLFPFLGLYKKPITFTALTSLSKYNPIEQLTDIDMQINSKQILWADFIVIPFTLQPLNASDKDLYRIIRSINSQCKIVYNVDFNFYELSNKHPYKKFVNDQTIIDIENNIWFSDMCMVSNKKLMDYLLKKMSKLSTTRMIGIKPTAYICCMPFYIHDKIVLEETDYDPQPTQKINETKPAADQNNKIETTANELHQKNDKKITIFFKNNEWLLSKVQKGNKKILINKYRTKLVAVKKAVKWSDKGFDILIYKKNGELSKSILKAIPKKNSKNEK